VFSLTLLHILPKGLLSRLVGWIARRETPQALIRPLMSWFVKRYQLDLTEAELDFKDYKSLNALFTRKLKPGLRPLGTEPLHPADGKLTSFGKIEDLKLFQIKSLNYSATEFLGEDAQAFEGGTFATYYLCPTDYHRVHSPVSGLITKASHLGATLWPVNDLSVRTIPNLFVKNERTVTMIDTPKGQVAVVMVGATNVGEMHMLFDSSLVTNRRPLSQRVYEAPILIKAGDPLGVFNMGSTAVVLYPKSFEVEPQKIRSGPTRVGASLL